MQVEKNGKMEFIICSLPHKFYYNKIRDEMGVACSTLDQNHEGIQHGQQTLDLRRPMRRSEDSTGINL
jgi:hypothetical protein